MTPRLYH